MTLIFAHMSCYLGQILVTCFMCYCRGTAQLALNEAGEVLLVGLVFFQVYLGDLLVWVYGLHTVPVVEATRQGVFQ